MQTKKEKGIPLFYWVFSFAIIAAIGAWATPNEKLYKVELPISEWVKHDRGMEYIKQMIRQSDLPSKQVAFITDSILTPFQSVIGAQINPVIQAEQKKAQDSLNKVKPNINDMSPEYL